MTAGAHAIRIGWRSEPVGAAPGQASRIEALRAPIAHPAVSAWCDRTFLIRAPYGFRARIEAIEEGGRIVWLDDPAGLPPYEVISMTPRDLWRAPDRPSIQWLINSFCVADDEVWAETFAPFMEANARQWPGVLLAGRLDIMRWTRPFQWVFEWQDSTRELHIEAGEPLQYVRLQAPDPDARFRLVDLPDTHEFRAAVDRCARIAPFKRNALAYLDEAYRRRPARLLPEEES